MSYMANDSMSYTMRVPVILLDRLKFQAVAEGISLAQFILNACREKLDGGIPYHSVGPSHVGVHVGIERTAKPDIHALRALVANIETKGSDPIDIEPERPMCSYTEYDPQTGETYACALHQHPGKVRHMRGRQL